MHIQLDQFTSHLTICSVLQYKPVLPVTNKYIILVIILCVCPLCLLMLSLPTNCKPRMLPACKHQQLTNVTVTNMEQHIHCRLISVETSKTFSVSLQVGKKFLIFGSSGRGWGDTGGICATVVARRTASQQV